MRLLRPVFFALVLSFGLAPFVHSAEVSLETATIADLQAAMAAGTLSSEKITAAYLARIAAYDKQGPALNSIITLNSKALEVAKAYLDYLYTPEGQEIAARDFYRPRLQSVAAKYATQFPKVNLFTVDEVFGGWKKAQKDHFDDGALYDQIVGAALR